MADDISTPSGGLGTLTVDSINLHKRNMDLQQYSQIERSMSFSTTPQHFSDLHPSVRDTPRSDVAPRLTPNFNLAQSNVYPQRSIPKSDLISNISDLGRVRAQTLKQFGASSSSIVGSPSQGQLMGSGTVYSTPFKFTPITPTISSLATSNGEPTHQLNPNSSPSKDWKPRGSKDMIMFNLKNTGAAIKHED